MWPHFMLLLSSEVSPDDLNGAVEQLTKSSIELSEAVANLGALKVMSGVFILFAILMLLAFLYQVFSTSKKVDRVDKSIKKIDTYFEKAADKSIGEAQAQVMVRRAFNSLSQNVKYTILRTRIENHIDNKEATLAKIDRLVNYEYTELVTFFRNFDYKEKPLSNLIDSDDVQILIDFIIEQVYYSKEQFSVSAMDQATNIIMNGLKLEYIKKL